MSIILCYFSTLAYLFYLFK